MSHHHRIIRFDMAADAVCPLGFYQWERTATGVSIALDNKDADTMRNALVQRGGDWTERDATDDYIIGTTSKDPTGSILGTIDLGGDAEVQTVAIPRANLERVLCTLHDFTPLRKMGVSFLLDTMETLADRIEAHIAKAEENGDVALLDAVEMVRAMRAILNRDVMHVSNTSAPMRRAREAVKGFGAIWSPDIRWPASGSEGKPVPHLVRGVGDDGEASIGIKLDAVTPMEAATAFLKGAFADGMRASGTPSFNVCIVRSATQETVFAKRTTGEVVTEAEWTFERGGLLLCPKPELPGDDHYFVETSNDFAAEMPGHPAARRGVEGWLLCHHCDAWANYNYGDGITEAIDEALAIVAPVKS